MPRLITAVLAALVLGCSTTRCPEAPRDVGSWLVYWDSQRGLEELEQYGSLFSRVSAFAYELDEEGHPVLASELAQHLPRFFELAERHGFEPWVTVVNDIRPVVGEVRIKGVDVLRRLFADPAAREEHAKILAQVVAEGSFVGLDLDYESLSEADAGPFAAFVSELGRELSLRGLALNVILEPESEVSPSLTSPRWTVMAYNLHGSFSGPGPRSTPALVARLGKQASAEGRFNGVVALPLSGFAWSPDATTRTVDWSEAQLLRVKATERGRERLSRVPYFLLEDDTVVWFEDVESLAAKWAEAHRAGFSGLMLWRLGGNDRALFEWLQR